uniref:RING-type domain-containing protein n=1 Tax=Varanus komodoensis TaxID=61221 RepID=A0A8D2LCH4_VARKO
MIPAGPRYPSETWCSLCRVYCPDPVCLPCGHNFCTACIGQRLGEPKLNISCLECGATARKRNLRPIKPPPLLASLVVERPKRQRLDSAPTGAAVAAPLKLFCKVEQKLMCFACAASKGQATETFVPVEEALGQYKVSLQSLLVTVSQLENKSLHAEICLLLDGDC